MTRIKEIKKQRKHVAQLLGGKCQVCKKKFGKNFHFHHIKYQKGEKKYSNFKNWYDYQDYVLDYIIEHLDQFALLCRAHHRFLEMLKALKSPKFERLIELTIKSRIIETA